VTVRSIRDAAALLVTLWFATAANAAELPGTIPQPKVGQTVPSPSVTTCLGKGYTCGAGFTCTTNTTSLGPNPDPQATLLYACKPVTAPTSCSTCPPGWAPQGTAPDGSFTCKPTTARCKDALALPTGGGYYCGLYMSG
jgi:hypothetical protein